MAAEFPREIWSPVALADLPRKELQALAKAHKLPAGGKSADIVAALAKMAGTDGPKPRSPFLKPDALGDIIVFPVDEAFVKEHNIKSWETWESEVMVETFINEADEDVWFEKGEAVVTPINEDESRGVSVTIKAGDFAVIPLGLTCEWDIKVPVAKHYREHI